MKKYSAYMSETNVFKVYFEAQDDQQATEMLRMVNDGEIDVDALPNSFSKLKDVQTEFAFDTLEGENNG